MQSDPEYKSPPLDESLWRARWQVIHRTIERSQLLPFVQGNPVFFGLLANLGKFASRQVDYFIQHARAGQAVPSGYTYDNSLASTLNQVSLDIVAITQAAFQRQMLGIPEVQRALERADLLARRMLQPAWDMKLIDLAPAPPIITYLQKWPGSRVIPYADIGLMGIPFSCVDYAETDLDRRIPGGGPERVNRDMLAIAHEAGHYVHWNAFVYRSDRKGSRQSGGRRNLFTMLGKELEEQNIAPWAQRWAEEIFADVYGTLVAGPMIVYDFQEFVKHYSADADLLSDDGEHPIPYLRNEVYCRALSKLGQYSLRDLGQQKEIDGWVERLRERWGKELDRRMSAAKFNGRVPVKGEIERPTRSEVEGYIGKIVDSVWEVLQNATSSKQSQIALFDLNTVSRERVFGSGAEARTDDELLTAAWDAFVEDTLTPDSTASATVASVKNTTIPADSTGTLLDGKHLPVTPEQWTAWKDDLVQDEWLEYEIDQLLEKKPSVDREKFSQQLEWFVVWRAGGWTTEGPQNDGPKP